MPTEPERLVKSKQRVADHGEVFTPAWMVEDMLNLVKDESERIDSRFLEPACGSGNFLIPVLQRKLATVQSRYGKSEFEKQHYALLALMSIYGVELLPDNVEDCHANMIEVLAIYLKLSPEDTFFQAGQYVLTQNIVNGDAMTMRNSVGDAIVFPEWGYLGKRKFQRRDFRFDTLAQRSAYGEEDTLFADLGKQELFTPTKTYPPLTVKDLLQ